MEILVVDMQACDKCGVYSDEVYECERCGEMICGGCQAEYNQFTQIDFNCCKSCAKYDEE